MSICGFPPGSPLQPVSDFPCGGTKMKEPSCLLIAFRDCPHKAHKHKRPKQAGWQTIQAADPNQAASSSLNKKTASRNDGN
mmetsp:Transcript_18572/g.32926  ORF Transcript_18572/g.32926 Transcript_18572/m.32926 type:complete len:81 (+) Transcript_18572:643-885(+)